MAFHHQFISFSVFQCYSLICLILFLLGVLNMHFSDKNNYCAMTYMFEYPQFVRITVPENAIYPQYGLYAYSEGRLTEKTRKMWFDGIPVLFLPGNSGSHMQGRSLASVALRKALASDFDFHFDYFMVSYNEDISGLYGGVLENEAEFAAACVTQILSLYKSNKYTKTVPKSVIVIGHSMGGVIAKRLLNYPTTLNLTHLAITLAAPVRSPVINTDSSMQEFYNIIEMEKNDLSNAKKEVRSNKVILSIGSGARDVLVPSGLTLANDSDINALTTSIPGVWVSPDHVSIVWCKQLVLLINRFLFSIVSTNTQQVVDDKAYILAKAKQYFQANRSMILSPDIVRNEVTMIPDAFWYEDNRRVYQIARPEITKTIYLMIRLVSFPQNRFVAIESVNTDDVEWVFGCNAQFTYGTHRYCKQATSLSELTRWTGAAKDAGKRKIATIHLHDLKVKYPSWSHVIVRVSPTRKPITLNVDINDHASRQISLNVPNAFTLTRSIIRPQTDVNSLYYELELQGFDMVYQAYLLYVEPAQDCEAASFHVSAEMSIPWAKNNEYYHYFTHLKRSPMKLRLSQSNPNVTLGLPVTEFVKVTLLLDPQCTYSISIASSWYYNLAQLARHYTPIIVPYVAAIAVLAANSNMKHLQENGSCVSLHGALTSVALSPLYVLAVARLVLFVLSFFPFVTILEASPSWNNLELRYFVGSLLPVAVYMASLGLVNVAVAALLAVMLFSSQLAHRLLFRIIWRGAPNLAEQVAGSIQKLPLLVSISLTVFAPLSCGAATLVVGAVYYGLMISKMFEEYLEDYFYKIMAKVASRICCMFKSKKQPTESQTDTVLAVTEDTSNDKIEASSSQDIKAIEDKPDSTTDSQQIVEIKHKHKISLEKVEETQALVESSSEIIDTSKADVKEQTKDERPQSKRKSKHELDEDLSKINFHMTMFLLWLVVTIINLPCLLTWARNFKYSMVLKQDSSYYPGLIMTLCSGNIWQIDKPYSFMIHFNLLSACLYTTAVFIIVLGPFNLYFVNYGVVIMFSLITVEQLLGTRTEIDSVSDESPDDRKDDSPKSYQNCENVSSDSKESNRNSESNSSENKQSEEENADPSGLEHCDECSDSRIYSVFKNIREKMSFSND